MLQGVNHAELDKRSLPLTTSNLKKFDRQFQRPDSLYSSRKIPQRTAADGKSEQHSAVSLHRDDHEELKKDTQQSTTKSNIRTYEREPTFYRPGRDSFRRNPEGRSQNGSYAVPLTDATKIYYDDTDYHIPYEDPQYVPESFSRVSNNKGIEYESSSYSSSSLSDVTKKKKVRRKTPSDGSIPSSTSAGSSSELSFSDDDNEDSSSEDHTTTVTKPASTAYFTRSTSSVSSLRSSIPSNVSESSSTDEELELKEDDPITEQEQPVEQAITKPTPPATPPQEETRPESALSETSISIRNYFSEGRTTRKDSYTSVAPSRESYITLRNWTRWGKYSAGGYSIADKIIPFNRRNKLNTTRTKRRKESKASSSSSPSTIKNGDSDSSSDESNTSDSNADVLSFQSREPFRRKSPTVVSSSEEESSDESEETSVLKTSEKLPHNDSSIAEGTSDEEESPDEEETSDEEGSLEEESGDTEDSSEETDCSSESLAAHNNSSQAIISKSFQDRKSAIDGLNSKTVVSKVDTETSNTGPTLKELKSKPLSSKNKNKSERTETLALAEKNSLEMTTKFVVAKSSSRNSTLLDKISQTPVSIQFDTRKSGVRSIANTQISSIRGRKHRKRETENDVEGYDFKNKTKLIPKLRDRPPRPKGGLTQVLPVGEVQYGGRRRKRKGKNEVLDEMAPLDRDDALSTFTSSSYTPPLHRRPILAAIPSKAKSSLSMTSTDTSLNSRSSSAASSDTSRRRRKNNVLRPLNVTDSGFASDRTWSSRESIRPVETPFTPVTRIIPRLSLRSIILSDDSGCSTYYRESDSCESRAPSPSLSSEGESTVIGPEPTPLHPPPVLSQIPPLSKKTKRKKTAAKEDTIKDSQTTEVKSKELPPVRNPKRKSSPYHSSMMPAILNKMKDLRESIKKSENKEKKKVDSRFKRAVVRVNHPMPSFESAYKDVGLQRLIKLAKPKESKAVWATSFWPVRWGDQTMVFPLSKTALKFQTTPRLGELAVAKKDFRKTDHPDTLARDAFQFSCGRSSVILEVSPPAMKASASARVIELAKHKTTTKEFEERAQRTNYIFGCGRSSPIWDVSEGAKTAEERERTMQLAGSKRPDPRYQPERPCIWPVSTAAQRASPSPRVEMLARPKTRQDRLHREPMWRVSSAAMRTVATSRVQELAKPKQTVEGYEHCKEIAQPLPRSVLRATATERIKTLSKPNIRETMDHVQFNPDAFKVSEAALKGRIPDRIADLAQPLTRN